MAEVEIEIRQGQKRKRTESEEDGQSRQVFFGVYRATPSSPLVEPTASPVSAVSASNSSQPVELSSPVIGFSNASPSVVGNEPLAVVGVQYAMSPVAFRMLFQLKGSQILLIDCRDSDHFDEKQVNFARCINVPIRAGDIYPSGEPRFTTKTAVVGFLQKHCPLLLLHLRAPGHFSKVVIIDERSSVKACSQSVKVLLDVVLKWNENTKTSVHVLEGGFQLLEKDFPGLIVASVELLVDEDAEQAQTSYADLFTENCPKELIEGLICYLKDQDESIDITRKIIDLRKQIRPLCAIKSVLLLDLAVEEERMNKQLESLIPSILKCPICLDIYRGEIFQCANGHSICADCCSKLARCPECRAYYMNTNRVRNRALESLLRNTLKVECLCGEKLDSNQIPQHVSGCVKTRKGTELLKLEKEIGSTRQDIEDMNLRRGNVNKIIMDTEHLWFSKLEEGEKDQLSPAIWRKFSDYLSVKKSTLCSLNKALFAMVFCE